MAIKDIKNFTTSDITKKLFNAQYTSTDNAIKELIKDKYQADTIAGSVFYAGLITEVIKNSVADNSFFEGLLGVESEITTYRIYVPEIHSGLGPPVYLEEPIDSKDEKLVYEYAMKKQKAKSFPIATAFFPADSSTQSYVVGDPVWIMFQNSKTQENGFILGKITQKNGSGPQGENGDSGGGSGSGGSGGGGGGVKHYPPPYKPGNDNPERFPAGMEEQNYRWLIDFSQVVDAMCSSKGYPYRYGYYPETYSVSSRTKNKYLLEGFDEKSIEKIFGFSDAEYKKYLSEFPNTNFSHRDFGTLYNGQDCAGFSKKTLIGFYDYLTDEGKKLFNNAVYYEFEKNKLGQLIGPGKALDIGQQLPGDLCFLSNVGLGGRGHIVLVASYPIKSEGNHSLFWGCNGGGPKTDGVVPHAGVGCAQRGSKSIYSFDFTKLFSPISFKYMKTAYKYAAYFRVDPKYVVDKYKNRFQNNGNSAPGASAEQNKKDYTEFIKNPSLAWSRQYRYPTAADQFSPDVVEAPDLFRDVREKIIQTAKNIQGGASISSNDYFSLKVKAAIALGEIKTNK